jgi:hypothetical protein
MIQQVRELDRKDGVGWIGEAGVLAVPKKDEWNVLVDLIQSAQLTKI